MADPLKFLEGAAITGAGIAMDVFSGGALSWIGNTIIQSGGGLALQGVFPARTPSPDMQANVSRADASLPILYGRTLRL